MTLQAQHSKLKPIRQGTQYLGLVLLLLIYLVVALAHAYLAPLTTGPDELAHYEYVRFIAEHGRLPRNKDERGQASYKSDQPPLFHLIAALPAALIDPTGPPYLKRVSDSPRRQLIERSRHAWGLYNTEDERWPYQAEVLRWHVGRWVAIVFGAATVAVTFFIARDLFTNLSWSHQGKAGGEAVAGDSVQNSADSSPLKLVGQSSWLAALGAAAVVGFIPRFALTGSMLNYETTLAFFAALFLWSLLRMAKVAIQLSNGGLARPAPIKPAGVAYHAPRSALYAALVGLFAGLAIMAKLSAIILPAEIILAFWLIKHYQGWSWTMWLRSVFITTLIVLLVLSWWFGFITAHFNSVSQDGWWVGLLRPLIAADSSDATTNTLLSFLTGGQAGFTGAIENLDSGPPWQWLAVFFRTFWVVGIEGFQPLGLFGMVVAITLCLFSIWGLISVWRLRGRRGRSGPLTVTAFSDHLVMSILLLHLVAAFALPLLRYAVTSSLADTAQGRHVLFLTAPAMAILMVWGLSEAVSSVTYHVPRITFLAPGLFLLFWSGVQLWYMTWAYNPLLPVRTIPAARSQASHQLNQPLNESVTLVGYNSQLTDEPMLRLELFWQATGISPVDYLTEVSLVDDQGKLRAQWLGYSANGRYPTRAWDVADIVRDTVWLPVAGLKSGQYQLNLDLIPNNLYSTVEPASSQTDPPLALAPLTLPDFTQTLSVPDFQIWQNGQALSSTETFRYRETILVTLDTPLANQQREVKIIGPDPDASLTFEPVRDLGGSVLFIVGPEWSTGDYRLRITPIETRQQGEQQIISEPIIRVIDQWQRQFEQPPIKHLVEANFANQVKLLGYDLGSNRAKPGGGIPVTLYWQGLDWMGNDYTIFTKLFGADQTVHGGRERLPGEGYRTIYWAPGEIIADPFGVPVDVDAPDGVYYLNVGLYRQVAEQAVSLPLVEHGQPIDASSVNLGPIKIGHTSVLTLEVANPQVRLNQPFGDVPNLILLGYDLNDEANQPISSLQPLTSKLKTLKLTLYWRSEAPLAVDYTIFVHLRNSAGDIVAQKDQLPLNGAYPTSLWDQGEIIADEIAVSLPQELPPDDYQLVVGLYDFKTGGRLTVPGNPENSLILTSLELDR